MQLKASSHSTIQSLKKNHMYWNWNELQGRVESTFFASYPEQLISEPNIKESRALSCRNHIKQIKPHHKTQMGENQIHLPTGQQKGHPSSWHGLPGSQQLEGSCVREKEDRSLIQWLVDWTDSSVRRAWNQTSNNLGLIPDSPLYFSFIFSLSLIWVYVWFGSVSELNAAQ